MTAVPPSPDYSPYRELFKQRWTVESIQHHLKLGNLPFKLIFRKEHEDYHTETTSNWLVKVQLTNNVACVVVHLTSGFSEEYVYIVCELEVTNGDVTWQTRDCLRNYHMIIPQLKLQTNIITIQLKVFVSTYCDSLLSVPTFPTPLCWSRCRMFAGHMLHELHFPHHTFEVRPFRVAHLSNENFHLQFVDKLGDQRTVYIELQLPDNIKLTTCTIRINVIDHMGYPMFTELCVQLRNGQPQPKKLKALVPYEDMYAGTQNFSKPFSVTLSIDTPFVCHYLETPTQITRVIDFDILTRAYAPLLTEDPDCDSSLLKLLVGHDETPIGAPTALLMANSEVFRTMFTIDMREKRTNIVRLPDFEPDLWRTLITFLVSGASEETNKNALALFPIAHCYQLQLLEWYCVYQLCMQLDFENLHDIKAHADLFDNALLKAECKSYMAYLSAEERSRRHKFALFPTSDEPCNWTPCNWTDVRLGLIKMKPLQMFAGLLAAETVRRVYENVYSNGDRADIVLRMGDCRLEVHSFVLKVRAPILLEIIKRNQSAQQMPTMLKVTINEDPVIFQDFVRYIYTGRSEFMVRKPEVYLRFGWQYGIDTLRADAETQLMSMCVHSNASHMMRLATKYEAQKLQDYILREVQATTRVLVTYKKVKSADNDSFDESYS